MPSTIDRKGDPVLEGAKVMGESVIYGKLMKVMIILNGYDTTINLSREDSHRKLDRAHYHVSCSFDTEVT